METVEHSTQHWVQRGMVSRSSSSRSAQPFYARTSDHGYETCVEHLCMAGCLSGGFASQFGYLDDGLLAGLFHDIGKYASAFQKRIRDPEHSGKVDHSTAGAMLLDQYGRIAAEFAVAAHHAGLADVGDVHELDGATLSGRMNKAFSAGERSPLALAHAWSTQLHIPDSALSAQLSAAEPTHYSFMMLTRMLLSALVDGDRLDAEFFTSNREHRAEHELLEQLKEQLGSQALAQEQAPSWETLRETSSKIAATYAREQCTAIARLTNIVEQTAQRYLNKPDKTPLDIKRCELLTQCLTYGKDSSRGKGLYTLTAPTGSGKTISSITFALEHARTHGLQRVIYVIPYTSIIDQTVSQFETIFGTDCVLPHYAEAPYQLKDESDMDETDLKRALAAENWNSPIVVTTAVQFFESLYSNSTSRCRKLHNIANAVIVFDEAQTLPVPYLRPCIAAIAELVQQYGSTAVLCTATQPDFTPLFKSVHGGTDVNNVNNVNDVNMQEISPFSDTDRDSFRRVTIEHIGDIALDTLADRLGGHEQVLCVVNTRKKAQYLYDQLAQNGGAEGTFCLTTLQCAADRKRLLDTIRTRLAAGEPCRVVSTSLIEAGVDVDFPVAYREQAGLDSVIQTAGRCNREGRHSAETSKVYVFCTEGGCAPFLQQNIAAFRDALRQYPDLTSHDAIQAYFQRLLEMYGSGSAGSARSAVNDAFDTHRILPLHGDNAVVDMPFERIARSFKLIDTPTVPVYIPLSDELGDEGVRLCEQLEHGDIDRMLFRKLGKYAVNVWPQHLAKLQSAGAVLTVGRGTNAEEECFILRDMSLYSSRLGLRVDGVSTDGIFV